MSTNCPFVAAGYIQRPELFIGRDYELKFIAHRLTGQQPTSINIYGERRIGKSSLLYHFYLTWENRVTPEERHRFAVVYLSVAPIKTESEFYQALAKTLLNLLPQNTAAWRKIWRAAAWTRHSFNEALKLSKQTSKVLPVVCLDDIETILKHPQDFDEGFYDNLRAAMGNSQLILVVASFKPLHDYKLEYKLTSLFFNQGLSLELKRFEATEVETLLLWADKANFTKPHQQKIRQWGKQHPYLLQLAGVCLWEALAAGKEEKFAQKCFEENKQRNLYATPLPSSKGWAKISKPFEWLGRLAHWFAEGWHRAHLAIIGMVMVIAVILILILGIHNGFMHLAEHPLEFFQQLWNFFVGSHPDSH